MKKLVWLLLALLLLATGACRRNRTLIPDEELAEIFRDVYLANTYTNQSPVRLDIDSLEIYTPIFEQHGYTAENVRYTIGNFSRRKSSRLSNVIERTIRLLEVGGNYYRREVAALDTIDNVARRRYTRTVYNAPQIRVTRLRDTSRLRITLKDLHPGDYLITYDYLIDSLDENRGARARLWLENSDTVTGSPHRITLRREVRTDVRRSLTADTATRRIVLDLFSLQSRRLSTPHVTIYNLRVTHTPPASVAVDSLYHDQLNIPIFTEDFLSTH